MSTRPVSQSTNPDTCPTSLDPPEAEVDQPAPPPPPPSTARSTNEAPRPQAWAEMTRDGLDVGFGLATGTKDGVKVDLFSASARVNADEIAVEGAVSRLEIEWSPGSNVSVEKLGFKVTSGANNADGSKGRNVSIGATLIGVEGTYNRGGSSITGGVSAGLGAEVAIGTRDFDKDGRPEFCARISAAFLTLGLCLEQP